MDQFSAIVCSVLKTLQSNKKLLVLLWNSGDSSLQATTNILNLPRYLIGGLHPYAEALQKLPLLCLCPTTQNHNFQNYKYNFCVSLYSLLCTSETIRGVLATVPLYYSHCWTVRCHARRVVLLVTRRVFKGRASKETVSADVTLNITQRTLLFNGFSSKTSKKNLHLEQRKFGRLQCNWSFSWGCEPATHGQTWDNGIYLHYWVFLTFSLSEGTYFSTSVLSIFASYFWICKSMEVFYKSKFQSSLQSNSWITGSYLKSSLLHIFSLNIGENTYVKQNPMQVCE